VRGLNKAMFIGNAGKNFETKQVGENLVGNGSLAVSDGKGGTLWIGLVAWGKTAELLGQFVTKGTKLYVEGRLQVRTFNGKNGERTVVEVVINDFVLLSPKQEQEQQAPAATPFDGAEYDDGLPF
jgi:single-strand DNA-binding protein